MRDAILIQQVYPGFGFEGMIELTRAHHQAYCEKYKMEYWCVVANPLPHIDPVEGAWGKIELMREALEDGFESVICLDADTLIVDTEIDLRDAIQLEKIGACWHRIPQLNHWNIGALYLDNCEFVRSFIHEWLNCYPSPNQWNEQGVFNRLALQSKTVVTVSDKWNATIDVSMVPDAVVLGFHGQGNAEQRYKLMQQTYERLFKVAEYA